MDSYDKLTFIHPKYFIYSQAKYSTYSIDIHRINIKLITDRRKHVLFFYANSIYKMKAFFYFENPHTSFEF